MDGSLPYEESLYSSSLNVSKLWIVLIKRRVIKASDLPYSSLLIEDPRHKTAGSLMLLHRIMLAMNAILRNRPVVRNFKEMGYK